MTEGSVDFLGLGYCGLDYLSILPRIPVDDKVEIIQHLVQGGGPAATATYAACRLGAHAGFIGATGDDDRGETIRSELSAAGIDLSGLAVQAGAESGLALAWVEQASGRRSIAWTRGTVQPLPENQVSLEQIRRARLLHLDGHHTVAAIRAARLARESGSIVSLDAGSLLPRIEEVVAAAQLVIASEKFAAGFTGEAEPERAVRKLFGAGTSFAAVTMGERGSLGYDGRDFYSQPAFPVEVVDTTGAGDVFHGAFAYRRVLGGDWRECLRFAAATAALKCRRFGGRTGIPNREEVESFLCVG